MEQTQLSHMIQQGEQLHFNTKLQQTNSVLQEHSISPTSKATGSWGDNAHRQGGITSQGE